jgi:hypothetical protein
MRIDSAELERVRYAFRDLAKAGRANARVSFRAFPGPIARDPARVAAIQKKYKLDMYFSVDISPSTSDQHVRAYSLSVRHITTQKLDEDFHRLLISHLSHIHDRSKMPGSASDLARRDGEHLAELFLGVIAIVLFSSNRHDDALPLLAKLDNQLSARFEALEFPRRAFRLIWMRCLCTPSTFSSADMPGPEKLEHALQLSSQAYAEMGGEFVSPVILHARNLFFAGRLDDALTVSASACGPNSPLFQQIKNPDRASIFLNCAVLNLMLGNWKNAADYFARFFKIPESGAFNWQELIGFADLAYEMGHAPAIYIRTLYRSMGRDSKPPDELLSQFRAWLDEDPSRNDLKLIYLQRPQYKGTSAPSIPKDVGRTPTKRFKRRK